jgi:NADH dehydrogenase
MGDLGQITPMKLDQRSEDSIARTLARSNIVINCIGSWVPTFHNTLSETHAEASARIAKVAKRMGVKQFVHISALSASPSATDAWSKSKWEGEVAVRNAFPEAIILRPGTMCGPEDKFLNRLADRMRSYPVMPEWGFGEAKVQPVSVYDVAEAVNVVANKGSAYHGRVFDLAGPKVYTMAEILSFIEQTCGMHANRLPVPTSIGLMMGSMIESAPYASL